MLSITPSKLETFRKFVDGEWNDWFTREMVIDQIRGTQKQTFKANLGTAIHEILEKGYGRYYDKLAGVYTVKVRVKGQPDEYFSFKPEELTPVMEYVDLHTRAVNEIPLQHFIKVNGQTVRLSMKIDQMLGVSATDHKTSDKEPKVDDFEKSVQWKIYLLATDAKVFTYNHFQYSRLKKNDYVLKLKNKEFCFYPYENMESDVIGYIQRFIMFCETEDLMSYIQYKEPGGVV